MEPASPLSSAQRYSAKKMHKTGELRLFSAGINFSFSGRGFQRLGHAGSSDAAAT